jgi:predicted transcriptional regulator YheO
MKIQTLPVKDQVMLIQSMRKELVKTVDAAGSIDVDTACHQVARTLQVPRATVRYGLTEATVDKHVHVNRKTSTLHSMKGTR